MNIKVLVTLFLFCLTLASLSNGYASNEQREASPTSSIATNPLNALGSLFAGFKAPNDNELLQADEAFSFSSQLINAQQIRLTWRIAEGYYLYRDKINVTALSPKHLLLGDIQFPKGTLKHDEFFGQTVVYHTDLVLIQHITPHLTGSDNIQLNIAFQGCADIGVCYPPMSKKIQLSLPTSSVLTPSSTPYISEQNQLAQSLSSNALWLSSLIFLGSGILLALTPCVFPMIPILSGIIIGHGKNLSTQKAFYLSLSYVLASAVTYAVFGVLAGLFGSNLQASFQSPWVITAFSFIFILLALSMFGLYQLQLPSAVQNKLSQLSRHQKHGSLLGSAIMGALSTLIVGPCVAAPLAGVLIYIGQTGDAVLGAFALFSLGLGMGIPLIIIGMSAGRLLPKAGHWMEPIKYLFGVILIALAIWLMERILPDAVVLILWACLLIICAVYLKVIDRLPHNASGWQRLFKGLGAIFFIYGVILILGAASGGSSLLKPLSTFNLDQTSVAKKSALAFQKINNLSDLEEALAGAKKNHQTVMLDFYADWCISCKEMDAFTFSDPQVQQAVSDMLLLQIDVTANNDNDREFLKQFSLIGPPAILFFDEQAKELIQHRVIGYMPSHDFLNNLRVIRLNEKG